MMDHDEREVALREADRMTIEASHAKQMGFVALAAFLRDNAKKALAAGAARKEAK